MLVHLNLKNEKCKGPTIHDPSFHHSRMGGGTWNPKTSFPPPLWTGDRVALQALDSHSGWDRTTPGRWQLPAKEGEMNDCWYQTLVLGTRVFSFLISVVWSVVWLAFRLFG